MQASPWMASPMMASPYTSAPQYVSSPYGGYPADPWMGTVEPWTAVPQHAPAMGGYHMPMSPAAPASFSGGAITEQEVRACQANWAASIKKISRTYLQGGDYVGVAQEAAGMLYAYGHSKVLFKPTKAAKYPFRPTATEAMSYFVGKKAVKGGYKEDSGFAINGGKGWSDVVFRNHQIDLNGPVAVAMGTYFFTCATTAAVSKVEYTFGYKRCADGLARIFLHHSSVPFSDSGRAPAPTSLPASVSSNQGGAPITRGEVEYLQDQWAQAITHISGAYRQGADYVSVASDAAGMLYGYGHNNVLFKPTKAAQFPFRPTANEAMSYFVGKNAVPGGYAEDGGFAINSGKGWSKVQFDNHQIDCNGPVAFAMGTYYFTCATTGDVARVEYTFGYKRCADGLARIFLHHSSVPFSGPKKKFGLF